MNRLPTEEEREEVRVRLRNALGAFSVMILGSVILGVGIVMPSHWTAVTGVLVSAVGCVAFRMVVGRRG